MSTSKEKKLRSLKGTQRAGNAVIYTLLVILSIVWIVPFILIAMESFRSESTWQVGYVVPKYAAFDNYNNMLFDNYRKNFVKSARAIDADIMGNAVDAIEAKLEKGEIADADKEKYEAVVLLAYSAIVDEVSKKTDNVYRNRETVLRVVDLYNKLTEKPITLTEGDAKAEYLWPVVTQNELVEAERFEKGEIKEEDYKPVEHETVTAEKFYENALSMYCDKTLDSLLYEETANVLTSVYTELKNNGADEAKLSNINALYVQLKAAMPGVYYSVTCKPAAYLLMDAESGLINDTQRAAVAELFATAGLLGTYEEDYVAAVDSIDVNTVFEAYSKFATKVSEGGVSRKEYAQYVGFMSLVYNKMKEEKAKGVVSEYTSDATMQAAFDLYKKVSKLEVEPKEINYTKAVAAFNVMMNPDLALISTEKQDAITGSFQSAGLLDAGIFKLTAKEWFQRFKVSPFPKWYGNTLLLGIMQAIIQTFMVLCMSYTLSRTRFKGRKFLMNFMLILGMFPGFITLIVLKKVLSGWNMIGPNAVWGLIIIYTASSAMGYYVCKGFFDTIPKSLDEAARVDGATRAQVFIKMTLPMAKPIIIYTLLTAFMAPWGDFMLAKYISNNTSAGMNVAVGIQNLISTPSGLSEHYTEFTATGVMVAIPVTILFMCLQKYYVEGVTGGAVKG